MSAGLFFTDSPPGANASKDAGFGAQPGDDGRNGVGITAIEQIPGTFEILVILDDGRREIFPLPRGPEGLDGITPEFVAGDVTYGPISTVPKLTPRRIALAVFALDLTLPDLTLATQAAAASLASAGASAGSASAAASSATAAQTARTGAEAALDSFDDRYLGAKASDPTTDNDGNALLVGALYYNTGAQPGMRVRTAAGAWDNAYTALTSGVTSFKSRTGTVVPAANDYAVADINGLTAALAGKAAASAVPSKGTGADLRALTDDAKFLTAKAQADAIATTSLGNTTGGVGLDFSAGGFNVSLIATGNITLAQHANLVDQKPVSLEIVQDGTGSRTLAASTTYNKFVGGTVPTLSTAAGSRDILYGTLRIIDGTGVAHWTGFAKDVK